MHITVFLIMCYIDSRLARTLTYVFKKKYKLHVNDGFNRRALIAIESTT